jgi:hypothetical protein
MNDKSLTAEMEKLIHGLKRGGLAFRRLEAAEKIGKLGQSDPRLVLALLRAKELDKSEEVRRAAAAALESPAHRKILDDDPGLVEEAKVEEQEILKPSVSGWISFGIAIVSILIIYADIFLINAQPAGVAPDGSVTAPPLDISPLFCLSFLLSVIGLVLGILGIRQYDRQKTITRLGLLGNGLIILSTLLLSMVVRFNVQ